jgi:hypothetical protein
MARRRGTNGNPGTTAALTEAVTGTPIVPLPPGPGNGDRLDQVHFARQVFGAALAEQVEAAIRDGAVLPAMGQLAIRDGYLESTAAEQTELLPAIPTATTSGGIGKATYRNLARQAVQLASGGEGLYANFVETMLEANASGFENRLSTPGQGNQQFVSIFNTFCRTVNADPETGYSLPGKERGMDAFQRQFIWHWWVSGLVTIVWTEGPVMVPNLEKRFVMPQEMTVLDPLRVDLDDFKKLGVIWYEYLGDDKKNLVDEIKRYGGPQKHPFFQVYPKTRNEKDPKQFSLRTQDEAYKELAGGKSRLPLPPQFTRLIRRSFNASEVYPVPFAARIYASVNDKRLLRAMDRSLMRKVIMMILLVTVESPDPRRSVKHSDLTATETTIETQLQADPEYIQIAAVPKGTDMKWVIPDPDAILNHDRYRTVDFEILHALVGIVANQLLNTSGNLDLQMVGKQLWLKNNLCLTIFRRTVEEMYDRIISNNRLRAIKPSDVGLYFRPFSVFDGDAFKTFISQLVMRGLLPVKLAVDNLGEDYQTVIEYLQKEKELQTEFGIFSAPPTNVQQSGPSPDEPGTPAPPAKPTPPTEKRTGPGGRPSGTPETQPRQPKKANPRPSQENR